MKKIVIIGGGGHAKVIISILKKSKEYNILGYSDINNRGKILDVNYLGNDTILKRVLNLNIGCAAAIGVGSVGINQQREKILNKLEKLGFGLPAIVSMDAIINEDVKVGRGTVVFDGAVINSGSQIGEGVIINTNSTVDHDCKIGDYVHIAPGVTISGGVQVGKHSLIGTGTSVIQYVKIGNNCIIGAGAVVVNNCSKKGTYMGIPAQFKS